MPRYTTSQFIDAIPGSGGIISTIAKRVGCDWITAKKYITEYPTVKAAYDAENESILDMSESVLINNIKLSLKMQGETGAPVDSGDARWLLSRKAKERGYVERQEVTGADSGPIEQSITLNVSDLDNEQLNKLIEAAEKLQGA